MCVVTSALFERHVRPLVFHVPSTKNAPEQGFQGRDILGRYRVDGELGRGGLATVFRATEIATGRVVALKVLDHSSSRVTTLFEREYHVLASLKHPSVIEVYDFGISDDGKRFYTMELLPGADLAGVSPLPWRDACRHVRDIAA